MHKRLRLLFVSLLLLSTACHQDQEEVEPTPTLEGEWIQQKQTIYEYDNTGKLTRQSIVTFSGDHLTLTATDWRETFNNYPGSTPQVIGYAGPYTRLYNTLTVDADTYTIRELTAHSLQLHIALKYDFSTDPYRLERDHYFTR